MTLDQLIACGIAPTQARQFLASLNAVLPAYAIDTPVRQAALIAQCAHESARFTALEESLFYRDPARIAATFSSAFRSAASAAPYASKPGDNRGRALANRAYAKRNGNGDEASGDGWRYRGRGLIQTTGRANYAAAGEAAGRDWLANPDELLLPDGAVLSAAIFFAHNGCRELADASNIDGVTRKVNPAMKGAAERRQLFNDAVRALQA